jgi:hypothetical protein
MADLKIRGLTLAQYAAFSAEAGMLRMEWEKSEGTLDIRDRMLAILAKYGQDPNSCMVDGQLSYHACGLIPEWHDAINADPKLLVEYSQLSGAITSKMMFGGAETSAENSIEGVSLEHYAETCAKIQNKSEAETPGIVTALGYYTDLDHWGRVRDGFNAAMSADTSLKLATHFGQLFAKYGQGHMAASTQFTEDVIAEAKEAEADRDELITKTTREIAALAAGARGAEILPLLKKNYPDDDNDYYDWLVDKALDMLAEAGNKDAARNLLAVRYDLCGETENKKEWIENELDSLF